MGAQAPSLSQRGNSSDDNAAGKVALVETWDVQVSAPDWKAGYWLLDIASPGLLKMMSRTWGKGVSETAPFKFAPEEDTKFFEPAGWQEAEYRAMFEESLRLKRTMPLARFWQVVGWIWTTFSPRKREEFKRFSGIVLMERRR